MVERSNDITGNRRAPWMGERDDRRAEARRAVARDAELLRLLVVTWWALPAGHPAARSKATRERTDRRRRAIPVVRAGRGGRRGLADARPARQGPAGRAGGGRARAGGRRHLAGRQAAHRPAPVRARPGVPPAV